MRHLVGDADSRTLFVFTACLLFSTACRPEEDPERVEFRSRLSLPARLSDDEVTRLVSWTATGVSGKVIRAREGGQQTRGGNLGSIVTTLNHTWAQTNGLGRSLDISRNSDCGALKKWEK